MKRYEMEESDSDRRATDDYAANFAALDSNLA